MRPCEAKKDESIISVTGREKPPKLAVSLARVPLGKFPHGVHMPVGTLRVRSEDRKFVVGGVAEL